MRKFDYSFLSNGLLPAKLINLTSGIVSLKTMAGVRKEEYAKVVNPEKSNVRIKFETTNSWYGFDFNEEPGEGKRLGLVEADDEVNKTTVFFQNFTKKKGFESLTYAAVFNNSAMETWPNDSGGFAGQYKNLVRYSDNINIIGIMGTLKFKN